MAALTNEQILDAIASMTVLEASELVKAMEEKFGVTAAVAVAAGPAAPAAPAEEQTEFTVSLDKVDAAKKIAVIKAVRAITGLGLGEAKALRRSSRRACPRRTRTRSSPTSRLPAARPARNKSGGRADADSARSAQRKKLCLRPCPGVSFNCLKASESHS